MKNLLKRICYFFQGFALAGFIGCANVSKVTIPENISISFSENGGMIPYGTKIFLSIEDTSFVEFFVDGLKNKVSIFPAKEELYELLTFMQAQNFKKIKVREEEAYDRGGNAVTLNLDGERTTVSNMGFSFIKSSYMDNYSKITTRILSVAEKHVPLQLQKIEITLDTSLQKEGWRTGFNMNKNLFVEVANHSKEVGFKNVFEAYVLPENSVYIRVNSDVATTSGRSLFDWNGNVVISKDTKKIKFRLHEGDIQIIYNDEHLPENKFPESATTTVIENQKLNALTHKSILQIELTDDAPDGNYEPFRLNIFYKNEETGNTVSLVKTFGSFVDTYADIHYQLIATGQADAPYLIFFSGQAGDEYNIPGRLVLFSKTKKIAELQLHDGNRINSKIIEIRPDWIKVKEAILCHQTIETTIAFSKDGLQRLEGFFPTNTVYPNAEFLENGVYELKSDLEVSVAQKSKIYKAGESITMTLQWIDFDLGAVFLKINEVSTYMTLEQFKTHEMVQSMAGAKCEMG